MASCGVERMDLLSRFNHSAQSSISERIYQYRMSGPGALAVERLGTGNVAFSVADCKRIDAVSSGSSSSSNCPGTIEFGVSRGKPL